MKNITILYIHGFGSRFDPNHEKIKLLEQLGTVIGVNVEYYDGFDPVLDKICEAIEDNRVDLVVGTSMGGYMATHAGTLTGAPFIALNPAITPSESLQRWVGNFVDYNGKDHVLDNETANEYPDISKQGHGMVMLDMADEVLSASKTMAELESCYRVETFPGGGHRFTHMEKAIPIIQEFLDKDY